MCAFRILLAILERQKTGKGKIVDASMVEGAAYVGSWLFQSRDLELLWSKERGRNLLDGGSPIYDTYETADGKYVAVGALEPQFHGELFDKLEINIDPSQLFDEPETVRRILAEKFRTKTRDEWATYFRNSDACVSPVLELTEVGENEHNKERKSFYRNPNRPQCQWEPAPDPDKKLDLSQKKLNTQEILDELGYSKDDIKKLVKSKIVEIDDEHVSKL